VSFRRPNCVFSDEYQALRDVIIEARREAGLTQRQMASRLGRSASHIGRIEIGERRVDTLELVRMAKSLGVEPTHLFRQICERIDATTDAKG